MKREFGLVFIAILALVYVLNAWTPSHYGEVTRTLGIARSGPVFGEAHPIRSDEWAVVTPYFQIAVANDLGPRNELSPFKEPLKAFFALPSRDWSMAFKPDLWGFLVLDPAHAYSLHFAVLALAMLGGFAILLRQLGCSPGFALAASCVLFLSQFVQVWWSSNAPVLALAPWPFVAFLWRGPWLLRLPAITCAVAVWLIGQLYPPFIISTGLALGFIVAAFRPEALRPGRSVPAIAAAVAGAGVAWLHLGDLIPVMAATVFPGRRVLDGGGVPALQLLVSLFPSLLTTRFEPMPLWPSNACEIAAVGSFLPLAAACFADHRKIVDWAKARPWAPILWGAGLALMAAWMLAPIPGRIAPVLNLVPPHRMLWGFGLLLLLGVAVVSAAAPWRITWRRIAIFVAVVVAAWAVSKVLLTRQPLAFGRFDLIVAPILLSLLLLKRTRFAPSDRRLVMLAVLATALATFGRFNPVQSAEPIFTRRPSPVLDAFRAYAAANPRHWVVAPGMYGAVINGAGVPAINHSLLRPQLEVFRGAYPELDPGALNETFNRYAHLAPTVQWAPRLVQADLVALPPDPFAIPLPVDVSTPAAIAGPPAGGVLEQVEAVKLGPRRWGVSAAGWSAWSGVNPDQRLRVAASGAGVSRIVRASAYRLPRPDVVTQHADPTAFAAGFGLRLEIETVEALDSFPRGVLSLVSVDPRWGDRMIGPPGQGRAAQLTPPAPAH